MVVLNVKRSEKALFLYETTLDTKVGTVLNDLCLLINMRLKVLRLADAVEGLACHGIAKPPNMRGLLEEQVAELKLNDDELERCEPVGGFTENPDPVEFRVGKSPSSTFKQLLLDTAKDVTLNLKDAQKVLTMKEMNDAIKALQEVVKSVYPMGLPEYEPVRMELENRETLSDCKNNELTMVADPQDTKLWFAAKELQVESCLRDYLGKNEKTKVVIKVASKKAGQPSRERVLSEQDEKLLLMHSAKRREEIQNLAKDSDDSYYDAPWADQQGLKKKVLGLDNISWKPF